MKPVSETTRIRIAACAAILTILCSFAVTLAEPGAQPLYPGITQNQHRLAQQSMRCFFAHHYAEAESLALRMHNTEQVGSAIPLSALLRFAMRVWRILNDEFQTRHEGAMLRAELDPIRIGAIRTLHRGHFHDSTRATRLFIEGGINGFNATLGIRSNPLAALVAGLDAVRMLESARRLAPQMNDIYLGLGLFQCALANEPGIVHVAIRLLNGMHVSLETGLEYLRLCADGGVYTQDGARAYLIQFLSPFKQDEVAEKKRVFEKLQERYPCDPFYVFLELDERLAFHRDSVFDGGTARWVGLRMERFDTSGFSSRRYTALVRLQLAALGSAGVGKELVFGEKDGFSFYPVFLDAAREKRLLDTVAGLSAQERAGHLKRYRELRNRSEGLLRRSDANPMLREYYLWHMEDGLLE